MLKICGDSICVPLEMIFKQPVLISMFPSGCKKGNCSHSQKRPQTKYQKWSTSFFIPICGKIFGRLIFNEMFIYFSANKPISKNQSGFQLGDPCINQLLSITHEIFTSFDNGLEVRSVFLDISKAFDKVWHEGIIFKLKQNGISGQRLHILSDFLSSRKQRVVLDGQNSSWANVHAGVPQGS